MAYCDPSVTRACASHSGIPGHRILPRDAYKARSSECDDPAAFVLPFSMADFRTCFSVRGQAGSHASRMEAAAFARLLKNVARCRRNHSKRIVVLTDAQALLFAVRKGRSSSPNFGFATMTIAAVCLAADLRVHPAYTPSRWNAADSDSRGVCRRMHRQVHTKQTAFEKDVHCLQRNIRRLRKTGALGGDARSISWASTCSDTCLAQPSCR